MTERQIRIFALVGALGLGIAADELGFIPDPATDGVAGREAQATWVAPALPKPPVAPRAAGAPAAVRPASVPQPPRTSSPSDSGAPAAQVVREAATRAAIATIPSASALRGMRERPRRAAAAAPTPPAPCRRA